MIELKPGDFLQQVSIFLEGQVQIVYIDDIIDGHIRWTDNFRLCQGLGILLEASNRVHNGPGGYPFWMTNIQSPMTPEVFNGIRQVVWNY